MTEISILGFASDNSSLLDGSVDVEDDKEELELSMTCSAEKLEAMLTEEAQRLEAESQEPKVSDLKNQEPEVINVPATSSLQFDAPPPPGVKIYVGRVACVWFAGRPSQR